MAFYRTGFVVVDIAETHVRFNRIIRQLSVRRARSRAARAALTAMREEVLVVYGQFNRELNQLALRAALDADSEIRRQLAQTRVRPARGLRPRLEDAIKSRPTPPGLPTGGVGVADIDELDKVVNPITPGYGPYWRAIEEGTDKHLGRRIHGLFFASGGPAGAGGVPPDPSEFRQHPVFIAGPGGAGTIQRAIKPHHFIARGKKIAGARWLGQLRAIERTAISRLP